MLKSMKAADIENLKNAVSKFTGYFGGECATVRYYKGVQYVEGGVTTPLYRNEDVVSVRAEYEGMDGGIVVRSYAKGRKIVGRAYINAAGEFSIE